MARHSVAALDWLVDAMDRNAEAFLRRTKAGSKLDRLAMRGPARVLIRYFLNVPPSHRHEYYLICGKAKYRPVEIERLAREQGMEDQ